MKDEFTGCEVISKKEFLEVLLPINIPNVFTPNGDGIHDTWVIDGLDTYKKSVLKVYNRWGVLVYSNNGKYSENWNGMRNGKKLPIGTYYYVIEFNTNDKKELSGYVTILK